MVQNKALVTLVVTTLICIAVALTVDAQQFGGARHVGVLWLTPRNEVLRGLEGELRGLASTLGQPIVIETRIADGRPDRLPDLARELVALKVEVIVSQVNRATRAAQATTSTVPIVMFTGSDPVGQGFIASLAHPGGNVTGSTWDTSPDVIGKNLEFVGQVVANLKRVAVFWNPTVPGLAAYRQPLESSARALGVSLQWVDVQRQEDFEPAFAAATRERAGALLTFGDPLITQHASQIAKLATTYRLPAIHHRRTYPESGGLMSYGPTLHEAPRRAVAYVEKILRGARAADLPVEQPTRYELVINVKTAKALGLTVPTALLLRADELIQ